MEVLEDWDTPATSMHGAIEAVRLALDECTDFESGPIVRPVLHAALAYLEAREAIMRRETTFLAVSPSMRLRIETTVENLLALLDEIEGDENLEDSGDAEPEETDCNLAGAMSDLDTTREKATVPCPYGAEPRTLPRTR